MKFSIVTTLYNSAPYLVSFYERMTATIQKITDDYEIIFVNDGSPDDSLELAIAIQKTDKHVKLIDLSRNFGHHKAIMTGLSHSKGENIFLIDSDLEEEPELLSDFIAMLAEKNCDVVYGIQDKRKGGFFERVTGKIFYSLFRKITGLNLTSNITTARLMTKQYVTALLRHQEREVFLAGLWYITGFEQHAMVIQKSSTSPSTYTLRRKLSLFVNSVTSFSNAPLVAIFNLGLMISIIAGIFSVYLVLNWFFIGTPMSGWTSILASIWLLGGMIILFIGVIGIYLAKVFSETKQRPYTIIKKIYESNT